MLQKKSQPTSKKTGKIATKRILKIKIKISLN